MSLSKSPPGSHIGFLGFQTLTLISLWISTPNFSGTILMYMGRSLLIFSDVNFKMAAWRPYWIFWFPDSNFKLMCPYFILLIYTDGERDGLWMACPFRTLVVLYRMFPFIICLILMNYLMEFYFIGFVNAHLPGCFCPWTFRLNIGLNTSPSDSFVSYLNSHLGYSAGEFQALQLIVLAVFGAVD